MNKSEIVLKIINEICPFEEIDMTTELIHSGILTSLDLFTLLAELESEFHIRIDEDLIVEENFVTVQAMMDTILKEV